MINSVLETKYRVHKTRGNLNSQIGVPLTILEIDKLTEVAVIEMGMSERGQIERLSQIVMPDIAVITMIGVSHLSTLGSRDEIAAAKMEIVKGLRAGGLLIYNGDEPLLTSGLGKIKSLKPIHFISFGNRDTNDYHATNSVSQSEGSSFTVGGNKYYIPLLGEHNISNSLATIAVASKMGLDPMNIDEGFRSLKVTGMRMEKMISPLGFTIINDAWNASPNSMKAAIKTFEDLTDYSKKHLVLGDMLELGEQEKEFHQEVGRLIDPTKIDFVYTVGGLSKHLALEAAKRFPSGKVQAFMDKAELVQVLKMRVKQDDLILLKGSRGIQLESILDLLSQ